MAIDKYQMSFACGETYYISDFYEEAHMRRITNLVVSERGVWEKWAQPNIC